MGDKTGLSAISYFSLNLRCNGYSYQLPLIKIVRFLADQILPNSDSKHLQCLETHFRHRNAHFTPYSDTSRKVNCH